MNEREELIYGLEIVPGTTLQRNEYENLTERIADRFDTNELDISLSTLEYEIREGEDALITLRKMSESGDRNIITLEHICKSMGIEALEYNDSTVSNLANRIWNALLVAMDVFLELLTRFSKWIYDTVTLNEKLARKVSAGIRYLISSPQEQFKIDFTPSEAAFFILEDKGFDVLEVLSLYSTLIETQINNKTKLKNVTNVLKISSSKMKSDTFNIRDYKIDLEPIFPVLSKASVGNNNMFRIEGPRLPKGYVLTAIVPDSYKFQNASNEEYIKYVSYSDVSLFKYSNRENSVPYSLDMDKGDLETLNDTIISFQRQCIDVVSHVRRMEHFIRKLKRQLSSIRNTFNSSDTTSSLKLNEVTTVMMYVIRTSKEPLITINKMAQTTNNILLKNLLKYIENYQTEK